jgi:arginyl-tRNA--protein-N-Asp/Glu arginylyltransferase
MARKRRGNKQFEARQIQLLRWRFERARHEVDDHFKVGKLPLEIDLIVIRRTRKRKRASARVPRLFAYFKRYNVMEIKTARNPLKLGDLLKLQAYAWLYMQKRKIYSVAEITATAVVHHRAPTLQKELSALGYRPVSPGIFQCAAAFPSYLISLKDLRDELVPEELQVFSNSARRQRVFLSCFGRKEKKPIIDTMLELYESEVKKLMALYNIKQKSMRQYVEALGKEKVIAAIRKDEHLAALSKRDLLAALRQEDVIAAMGEEKVLKSLLAKLGRERMQKLIDQIHGNGASRRQSSKSKAV